MKSLTDTYNLSNGVKIPVIGFGTWQVEDGRQAVDAVKAALSAGYRHIDTAQGYGNEESVGRAVKDSGVKRDEIFITSKLVNSVRGYKQTKAALDESLGKLGGYIDLFLLHWPVPVDFKHSWKEVNAESWRAMEEYFQAGKIRALGVSNFHGRHVDELLKTAKVKPVVNQIRLCPGDTQDEVVAYSREKGWRPTVRWALVLSSRCRRCRSLLQSTARASRRLPFAGACKMASFHCPSPLHHCVSGKTPMYLILNYCLRICERSAH
jgi:diketogulonate reductase-like aldo/keto reductase